MFGQSGRLSSSSNLRLVTKSLMSEGGSGLAFGGDLLFVLTDTLRDRPFEEFAVILEVCEVVRDIFYPCSNT